MRGYPYKRTCTILRPDFGKDEKRRPLPIPKLSDYIRVPVVATHGTWAMADILPFETLAVMAQLRKTLETAKR